MNTPIKLKQCANCKCKKAHSDFTSKVDGRLKSICRKCERAGEKHWRRKKKYTDPLYRNEYKEIRNCRKFGITPSEKFHMYCSQNGVCAICGIKTALHIDHCHKTQKVRGLLCSSCNKSIGLMRELPYALRNAADYIERYNSNPGPVEMLRKSLQPA